MTSDAHWVYTDYMNTIPTPGDHSKRFVPKESIGRPQAARLEGVVKNRGIKNVKKPKGVRGS